MPDEIDAPGNGTPMPPQQAFAELSTMVLGQQPLSQVLLRVAELAVATIPGADEISMTLVEKGVPHTAAFTGSLAAALDERQYAAGFGPCVDAAQSGNTIRIDDVARDTSYRDFSAIAARQGVRSILSLGLPMPQQVLAAMNIYQFGETPLDAEAEAVATEFGRYAAVSLANASLYEHSTLLAARMQHAMESRAVIDQAKGMIMITEGVTADEAFQRLVAASQSANRKLRDLAAEMVREVESGRRARR
ncbi:ANTAR domain-containing protein [Kineococcus rubinsiae]|uniref:ANTAR domain-containing protein n=1 Tax=Kineococcus rubinsiae TaxID=2609562 RepID=UPI0014313EEE|nr:GAF and ANTAR domain-containing protein [Kineococcus rubinsiae]NIZ89484.1 GAF and ANTAR domain-containing protein [Kineococcus rubinsiae]